MAPVDTSIAPYFDTYNELKKFYRILFRPGFAVQARELTQLQTILQKQIERFGKHIFEEGAMVIPGQISHDVRYSYVIVENSDLSTIGDVNWRNNVLNGNYILGDTTGAKAQVLNSLPLADANNKITLFIKYVSAGTSGSSSTFSLGEGITAEDPGGTTLGLATQTSNSSAIPYVGVGTAANIKKGVYFVRNHFVLVDDQTLIIDPYNSDVDARVGFNILETIVTTEDDPDELNDNAQGSPNFAAPGAHRLKFELVLVSKGLDTIGTDEEKDFIELLRLEDGQLQLKVVTTDYSELEKTLARRTYDESGDYTVRPFFVNIRDNPDDTSKLFVDIDPGKAYVRGYEIETIAKKTLNLNKARTTSFQNNSTIHTRFGNYTLVTGVFKLPDITTYALVELRDDRTISSPGAGPADGTAAGNVIGFARCRAMDYFSGNPGNTEAIYKLYLFDITMNSGKKFEQVRSIHDSGSAAFNCNIQLSYELMEGTISISSTALTGKGTTWISRSSQVLHDGDWLYLPTEDEYVQLDGEPTTDLAATLVNAGPTIDDQAYGFAFAELVDTGNTKLVFDMPDAFIKQIASSDEVTIDTNYSVYRRFVSYSTDAGGVLTLNAVADEEFASLAPTDYIITINSTGDIRHPTSINPAGSPVGISVELSGGLPNNAAVTVIAPVRKKQAVPSTPKPKFLRTADLVVTGAIDTNSAIDLRVVDLAKSDIFRILKIVMAPNFLTVPDPNIHPDIKDRYDLDDGQRDSYYANGKINLSPGSAPATGRLLVQFEWFEHGSNGNFFSVDSYPIPYEDIPNYISKETNDVYELRDCLDFRPRINDAGTNFIVAGGASLTEMPRGDVVCDYHYYLARRDKLFLTTKGEFVIKEGVPSPQAGPADNIEDAMFLYELNLIPYTIDKDHVSKRFIENKRYTMRDIGKLEQRIEKIEYYTSLSLLEKETADLSILDEDGNDRFKNGFIADPFNGHGIGDVVSPEYRCSIDMNSGECRPAFSQDNVNLVFDVSLNDVESYSQIGDLFTLPIASTEVAIEQPQCTSAININPYAIRTFVGMLDLVPPSDEWKDTETLPTPTQIDLPGDFDAVQEAVDGLGTVWGEWSEHWTGTPVETGREIINQDWIIPGGSEGHTVHPDKRKKQNKKTGKWEWHQPRDVPDSLLRQTRITTTQTGSATRTGVRLKASPKTVTVDGGDRVVNVAYIPFMRQKDIVFKAKGLKPSTRMYPFFDTSDVSLNTAPVAVGGPYDFVPGNAGLPLITDVTGKVEGVFRVPAGQFQTGERTFRLIDRTDNDRKKAGTFGEKTFRAQGLLETHQGTIISTRVAEITSEVVDDEKLISRTDTSDLVEVLKDPLAQSFQVIDNGGMFITKVVVFFETKDQNLPVTLQLREIVNGYPGPRILPFSEVMMDAADVHTNEVTNGVLYIDDIAQVAIIDSNSKPLFQGTEFIFPSPVYVQQNSQYAFVLLSDSNEYNVWIAKAGGDGEVPENMVGTEIPIQSNPYIGVMFKSQNASTWTADQTSDIKFEIHKAQFEASGEIVFVNDELPSINLGGDPIEFKAGSNYARVHHRNHGFRLGGVANPKVVISGVVGTSGALYGVSLVNLNKTHSILFLDQDSYIINVTDSCTLTDVPYAFGGGTAVIASQERQMENIHPIIGQVVLPNTNVNYSVKATTSRGVHGAVQTPYNLDDEWIDLDPNSTLEFLLPRMVCSEQNEIDVLRIGGSPTTLLDHKSLRLRAIMATTNPNISPVVDIQRLSVIAIGSRLDNPSVSGANSLNHSPFDEQSLIAANGNITFTSTTQTISTTNGGTILALQVAEVGKSLVVSGAANANNNGTFRIVSNVLSGGTLTIGLDNSNMVTATGGSITIKMLHRYVSELAPTTGSATAKYISKRIVLSSSATALKIVVGAYRPASANIDLYYKILKADDNSIFDDLPWVLAPFDSLPAPALNGGDYREYTATVNGLPDYVSFATKTVLTGSDPSDVPRLRDFRAIALAV